MRLFLSWSGPTSLQIAAKLHEWLPMVIQRLDPYHSSEMEKGTRWTPEIARELESSNFGIACVTPENWESPWLLFEAGALSKSVEEGRVAPILFGLDQTDIQKSPLSQFQMTKFERLEMFRLLRGINELMAPEQLDEKVLEGSFNALWPMFERDVEHILSESSPAQTTDDKSGPDRMMGAVEELLSTMRAVSQTVSNPERMLPAAYMDALLGRHLKRRTISREDGQTLVSNLREVKQILAAASDGEDGELALTAIRDSMPKLREIQLFLKRRVGWQVSPNYWVSHRRAHQEPVQIESESTEKE